MRALVRRFLSSVSPVGFVAALAVASFAPAGHADIFALEPGKRIKGHQGFDCDKCHESAEGVSRNKCLGCHDHKPLARRIRAKKGLHARPDYQKGCETCHLEHKGAKYNPIDWRPLGGKKRFNHDLTGYKLEGAHKRQDCKKCHEAKYKKSGRTMFLGLDDNCLSCHDDVHRFQRSHPELTECKICHSFDARAVSRAKGLRFDHGKVADFPLYGQHEKTKCANCHTSTTIFKMKTKPEKCEECHKDPHNNIYTGKGRDCKLCHSDKKDKFLDGRFNHGKHTRFTLKNEHAKQKCTKCHDKTAKDPPRLACKSCHADESSHIVGGKDRFARRDCGQCHNDKSFEGRVTFAHAKQTGFTLGGKHGSLGCAECHRKKPKSQIKTARDTFEFFSSGRCTGCHAHTNAHEGKFNDRPALCTKCHVPGSTNIKTPKHSELSKSFAQQGAHEKVSCEKCHGEGLTNLKVGDDCSSCHKDDDHHEGNLGTSCKDCHFEGYPWSDVIFDHNKQSEFHLEGKHQAVSCTRCHTNAPKAYKPLETSCVTCHGEQDVHDGALGTDCERCHDMLGGTPAFDHNTMTEYPLEGAHARADCRGCHYAGAEKQTPASAAFELDFKFPVAGMHCADCHGDPHGLRRGAQCLGCHDYESFLNATGSVGGGDTDGATPTKVPSPDGGPGEQAMFDKADHRPTVVGAVSTVGSLARDQYHDVPPFSLRGGHGRLECHRCHGERGDLTGFGQACDTCHRQDDIHAGGLGPKCADCHSIRAFLPARFSHTAVGFALVGAHRMVSCKNCHAAGNYMGVNGDCVSCHLDDAIRAEAITGVPHGGGFIDAPCINCHNQVSWTLNPFMRRRF
jgi:hypothetical protein